MPNFLIINKLSSLPENHKLFKRDHGEPLISEVGNVNLSEVLGSESGATDVNTVFHFFFYDRITEIINKHAPIRKLSRKEIKSLSKPWVTPGIKTSIRNKEKFYKRFIETRNLYFFKLSISTIATRLFTYLDLTNRATTIIIF